ncbi:unnamed protein product [Phytophthora fragariaefolia]|uniref:Unnamed protein product n=1 Tax=Phytophthora fragariaefolia TaxID=1490495 RepID=A0A9W6XH85_9STRA|nr:unnamed protein product [Phytophthora fragariaefolia]
MRTLFTFEDDKELVQLVHSSSSSGSRISWSDVARRMGRSGHQASALKKRLPRGRRPDVIRQLRAASPPPQNKPSNYVACLPVVGVSVCDLTTEASESSARHIESAATADAPGSPGDIDLSSRVESISVSVADDKVVQASSPLSSSTEGEGTVIQGAPPLLSSVAVDVAAIFADVHRQLVMQDQNEPHCNAGELMPEGISSLLDEIGSTDEHDLFLNIGAGVGNVVAHVALGTSVSKAIGIELRQDICCAGMKMMMNSSHAGLFWRRTEMICENVAEVSISCTPPFALVAIVYWNNGLFKHSVIEYVKDQLCGMTMIRILVSSLNFCA